MARKKAPIPRQSSLNVNDIQSTVKATGILAAFERSELTRQGFFDNDYVRGLLAAQMSGSGGHSFQLWTVLNAVLWHASWLEGRQDCF